MWVINNYSSNKLRKNAHKWEDAARADENRLVFEPDYDDPCFINKAECNHVYHRSN
jgi:hypothetical protein